MRTTVSTLIVDLDNTLYDWFEIWHASFQPVYRGLTQRLGLSAEDVEAAIRPIHQLRRTSEYTFLLDELQLKSPDGRPLREYFSEELAQSRAARDRALRLYPSVLRTLWEVKRRGTRIVAYTESLAFYSGYRLKRLGLDGVIDYLFSPVDHDVPNGVDPRKIRSLPDEQYELQVTEVRHTPAGEIKPNPKLLREIISSVGADPKTCLYIGDSLFKDVAMAQDAGVHDVFAEYGAVQSDPRYDLLRRVSHWTDQDVEREKSTTKRSVRPSYSVEFFGAILQHFDFGAATPTRMDPPLEIVVDLWKKVVDVQQHFNGIEIQIRNYALTISGAILAAAGIAFKDNIRSSIFGISVPVSLGLCVVALTVWAGFWFMDRHWYHRLLKGAVDHASDIETRYASVLPEIALGRKISKASPVTLGPWELNSNKKIDVFYSLGALVIVLFGLAAWLGEPTKAVQIDVPRQQAPAPATT